MRRSTRSTDRGKSVQDAGGSSNPPGPTPPALDETRVVELIQQVLREDRERRTPGDDRERRPPGRPRVTPTPGIPG